MIPRDELFHETFSVVVCESISSSNLTILSTLESLFNVFNYQRWQVHMCYVNFLLQTTRILLNIVPFLFSPSQLTKDVSMQFRTPD